MSFKLPVVLITWAIALLLSLGLRVWGEKHPDPFLIRTQIVWLLLCAPSGILGFWVLIAGFNQARAEVLEAPKDVNP